MTEIENSAIENNANETDVEERKVGDDSSAKKEDNSEIARLKAELVRQKAAIDRATKEASDYKKALRAKQSAEEIAAEEQKAQDEATKKELESLRREVANAKAIKTVMSKLGTDEETSGKIAEYLYGAEDVDAALNEFQKAWAAREKALRLEYGKIPAPGVGASDGPTITKEQLDGFGYKERLEFAAKYPEAYEKLMGR